MTISLLDDQQGGLNVSVKWDRGEFGQMIEDYKGREDLAERIVDIVTQMGAIQQRRDAGSS